MNPESQRKTSTLELAIQRTRLAEERTYNAWLRTGMTTMGFGLALAKFFTDVEPLWLLQLLAVSFVLGGGITVLLAFYTHYQRCKEYGEINAIHTPIWVSGGLGILLILITALVLTLMLI